MHPSSALYFAFAAAFTFHVVTALAIPVNSIQMGSRHNLYLTTCTQIVPDDNKTSAAPKYTAVAYFANGPIELSQSLTDIATVTDPAQRWEGTQRVARLGNSGSFSSRISTDAAGLKKGEIAGYAVMDDEDFVCFKDGSTAFVVTKDLTNQPYTCKTDYWCPSIVV
jgi:hypothetical protein